ncbi:MAG TPA: ATP-binding protein, partial [Streptosporangiaceae bacterium]
SAAHLTPVPPMAKPDYDWLDRWPLRSYLELGALLTAPGCARAHIGAVLREWELSHIEDDACLIASELITNAVQSTRAERRPDPVRMWMLGSEAGVLFLIWDATMPAPVHRVVTADAEHGRGLTIVDTMADRCGSYQVGGQLGGKIVWALVMPGRTSVRRIPVFPLVNGTRARNRAPIAPHILARVKAALERMPPVAAAQRGGAGDAG